MVAELTAAPVCVWLTDMLEMMHSEADSRLPPFFYRLDEVRSFAPQTLRWGSTARRVQPPVPQRVGIRNVSELSGGREGDLYNPWVGDVSTLSWRARVART